MTPAYADIMDRGRNRRDGYVSFLRELKASRKLPLENLFAEAHDHAFSIVDCLVCGRCCTGLGPRLRHRDVDRLAALERMKPKAYIDAFLRTDEDGDLVFREMPCRYYGADGLCLVYDARPEACRDYPHLDRGRQKSRIALHSRNLAHCPAVILAVEYLMKNKG